MPRNIMKVLMKDIEVIALFKEKGHPVPLRFRYYDENIGNVVVPINRVVFSEEEKIAGKKVIIYRCQSYMNNIEKIFELKFEIDTCKWYLYKL